MNWFTRGRSNWGRKCRSVHASLSVWMHRLTDRYPRLARFLGLVKQRRKPIFLLAHLGVHTIGFCYSIEAVMQTRTEQGAIGWAVSLNTIPWIAVPAWFVFGDSNMDEYITVRRAGLDEARPVAQAFLKDAQSVAPARAGEASEGSGHNETLSTLSTVASLPVLGGNRAELLKDGEETYDAIFRAIEEAKNYVLIQFYIVRDDDIGRKLKDLLVRKARSGVQVYFLADGFGSLSLPDSYFEELKEAGAQARYFLDFGGKANRFQINFQNHRKIVVVDGHTGFVGGLNVGDEYLGKHPELTPWRDTHMLLQGAAARALQIPFVEDWHWASGEMIDRLEWKVSADEAVGDAEAVIVPTGPADPIETCSILYLTLINNARDRVWIATPYFVPDEKLVTALQLASLRGVDVRILMPELSDSTLVKLSSFSYLEELDKVGVSLFRYEKGFLHQKVVLIDDNLAAIGSANFDNRSFRLNFEVTGVISDPGFAREVEKMLETDFRHSRKTGAEDYASKGFLFRLAVRVARLLAPIQ